MMIELLECGLHASEQQRIEIFYSGQLVGGYYADIVVDECVILELKAVEFLSEAHEFQLINYLKASRIEVGLLLNFGRKPEFKRKMFSNKRKAGLPGRVVP